MSTMARNLQRVARGLILAGASSLSAAVAVAVADDVPLNELLFRANQTVVTYQKQLSGVVAEEKYVQRLIDAAGTVKETRTTISEYLMVQLPDEEHWVSFRDVVEVDGKPVRDRDERLARLFLKPGKGSLDQARKLLRESSRYNLGPIDRTINVPTLALAVLHPLNQHRFNFEQVARERVGQIDAAVLRYTEHVRPTIVRSGRADFFSRGRLWLDPETGRALRTEIVLGDPNTTVRSAITVDYAYDEGLKLFVPIRMREVYDNPRNARQDRIEAEATYSRFRLFTVETEESIRLPGAP
jgi:hypothetical protein